MIDLHIIKLVIRIVVNRFHVSIDIKVDSFSEWKMSAQILSLDHENTNGYKNF
jgi:hypothetical protein